MAKLNPAAGDDSRRFDDRKGLDDYVNDLVKMVHADETDRIPWIESCLESYNRRYAASLYNKPMGTWPWLGASNIDSGLSDIHVEELKPPLMNLSHGARRVYEFVPMNAASVDAAPAANMAMDSLLKYRMPDYLLQLAWGIDSLGTYGLKTDKVVYSYVTRVREKVYQRNRLPTVLSRMAVYDDFTEADRRAFAAFGAAGMSKKEFDTGFFTMVGPNGQPIQQKIEDVVVRALGLDLEDKVDRVALAETMRFLRNGSGESSLMVKTRQVIEDTPRLINVPIQNVIVPQGTRAVHEASRITHNMFFTEAEMRQRARDDVWDSQAVDVALEGGEVAALMRHGDMYSGLLMQAQMERARVSDSSSDEKLFRIAEIHTTWDIDGDGLDEDIVITVEPKTKTVLKAIPWDDEKPFIDTFLEATDQDRHASRGVPRQIADYEQHATALMRGEINNLTTETSRTFKYVEGSGIDPLKIQWMPNLMLPVQSMDDIDTLDMAPRSLALEQPMRNMMGLAERRVSGFNRQVLDNPPPERRTAAEIGMFQGARRSVMTMRAMLYLEGQKRAGKLIWNQFVKHGPDRFFTFVTGQPPLEQSMADVTGDFMITPVAAAGDMDPEYRGQRAFQRLAFLSQPHVMQAVQNDPKHYLDIAQAIVDYLNEDDPQARQRLMPDIPPDVQKQILELQQQNAQKAEAIAELGQRTLHGAPLTEEQVREMLIAFRKLAPHKELQQILVEAQAARSTANRSLAAMSPNGGP